MAVIQPDWAVRNSTRKYPLDDTATTVSDDNAFLPESFLVDCNIWAPEITFDGGRKLRYLYVGSASVSKNQVSFTILGTAGASEPVAGDPVGQQETPFIPLATISIMQADLVPYKNYAIVPTYEGVSGWVTFGDVTDSEPFNLLFSTPRQSMLTPKCGRFYAGLPTPGITVGALRNLLVGDVELLIDNPVAAVITEREVEGVGIRNVIEIKMVGDDGTGLPEKSTMEGFSGKCYRRPESGTCNRKPVQRIAGVSPDENGRITVQFSGLNVRRYSDGVCIDSAQGLTDACAGISVSPDGLLCDVVTPYSNTFNDNTDFSTYAGYFYAEGGTLYAMTGGYDAALGGTCLRTIDEGVSVRAFTVNKGSAGAGASGGQYFCDSGSHRVVVMTSGAVFVEDKFTGGRTNIGSASVSNPMTVLVSSAGTIGGVTVPAAYWSPTGGTGLVVYDGEMTFTHYGVVDA